MIIVEGPDNAGKSTLVEAIKETCGAGVELSARSKLKGAERDRLAHQTPDEQRHFVYGNLSRALYSQGPVAVHDRLFFSELVYGPIFHPPCVFNWEEQRHITRILTAISPPIIFCLPPFEVITNDLDRHQLARVRENRTTIYEAYVALSSLARPRITLYDFTRGPAAKDRVLKVVERYLKRREKRTW